MPLTMRRLPSLHAQHNAAMPHSVVNHCTRMHGKEDSILRSLSRVLHSGSTRLGYRNKMMPRSVVKHLRHIVGGCVSEVSPSLRWQINDY